MNRQDKDPTQHPAGPSAQRRAGRASLCGLWSLLACFLLPAVLHAAPEVTDFVVFARGEVVIDKESTLTGDVGSDERLQVAKDVRIDGSAYADRLRADKDSLFTGDIHYNALDAPEQAIVEGERITPLALPVLAAFPEIAPFATGSADVRTQKGAWVALVPGDYDEIVIGPESQVLVAGGSYRMRRLVIAKDSKLVFLAPVEIYVGEVLQIRKNSRLAGAAGIGAADVQVRYAGTAALRIEKESIIAANILAPHAEIRFGKDSLFRGALFAERIRIEKNVTLTHDNALSANGNRPPQADAGPDQTVHVGDSVTFDGSGSSDLDGDALTFSWQALAVPPQSGATLVNPNAIDPVFLVDMPGHYVIELVVSDAQHNSTPDTVFIDTENSPPVADAGPDQSAQDGDDIALDGSASYDVDGQALSFHWELFVPPGSSAALNDPEAAVAAFDIDRPGTYLGRLTVNDGVLDSVPDTVAIATNNSRPHACIATDARVNAGTALTLDGGCSSDADGNPLTYHWSLTSRPVGSATTLSDADNEIAGLVPDLTGLYLVQLIVADAALDSAPSTALVEALPANRPPQIHSEPATTAVIGEVYRYAVAASDPDADPLVFVLDQAPDGMAIDTQTGLVSWTPGQADLGTHTVRIQVTDSADALAEQTYTLSVEEPPNAPPAITSYPVTEIHLGETYSYQLVAQDPEDEALVFALEQGPAGMSLDPDTGQVTWIPDSAGDHPLTFGVTDPAGNRAQQSFTLQVLTESIPVDPTGTAPPLDPAPGGDFVEDVRFLFEGPEAPQTGLQPGALETRRVAVLRGQVRARGGEPLAGVRVSIQGAPELGHTLSRNDGWFDLVVNGGGELSVHYAKPGWLPAQRVLRVPAEDYAILPEVALTPLDPLATVIELGEGVTQPQIAQGSRSDDGDGPRQATVYIPPGTTASYTRADGTIVPLETMTLRATEYTVGPDGPKAMPGELPASSGYTYAVELSADEALADGVKVAGKDVVFNQPVAVYVDNFIGFPVGTPVPVGYYDNDAARWVASDNGRVIAVLSTDGGPDGNLAELDLDGTGLPADAQTLAAEGIDEAERARLATTYAPGTELWRFRTGHLSTWDCNWPYGPPEDAGPPPPPDLCDGGGPGVGGSDIRIGAGTISERIGLSGSGQSLVFNSTRRVASPMRQPLNEGVAHPKLKRTEYQIGIAGRVIAGSVTRPTAGQSIRFNWNGRDAYGRSIQGPVTARIRATNVYEPVRYEPAEFQRVFGTFLTLMADPQSRGANAISLRGDRANFEVSLSADYSRTLGAARAVDPASTLGGGELNLSDLPLLDPKRGVLTGGSGGASGGTQVLQSLIGAGRTDGPAVAAPVALARDATGTLLMASSDAIVRLVDGTPDAIPGGDRFRDIRRVRTARSGDLLVLAGHRDDGLGPRLYSLSPTGEARLLAGSGQSGCGTEIVRAGQTSFGLPFWDPADPFRASAAALQLTDPSDIAVGRDGEIYLADAGCHVIYRLPPGSDDLLAVAGNGTAQVRTDAGPAGGLFRPALARPLSLALDGRGNLYIGTADGLIRHLGTDNWIETIAGTGEVGYAGDGGPAIEAQFGPIDELLITANGTLYLDDSRTNARLRRIDPRGRVQTIAGTGTPGAGADGLSADGAAIGPIRGLTLDGNDRLHFGQDGSIPGAAPGIRRIASAYAAFPWQPEIRIRDGERIRIFDTDGRPLRTLDAETGTELGRIHYDAQGQLAATLDEHDRETRIERDGQGRIVAILAPTGQRTHIGYNAFGRPTSVTQPDGAQWGLEYDAAGLLTRYTDPNGHATTFLYDSLGRLVRDTDAAGGGWTLAHDLDPNARQVRYTSGEGRVHRYTSTTDPATGISNSTTRAPHGGERSRHSDPVARTSESTGADGSVTRSETLPSAVPAGAAQDSRTTTTLPSGLTRTTETRSTWSLAAPTDPETLIRTGQTTQINGDVWTTDYDPATRIRTATTPEGRTSEAEFDELNRPVRTQTPGLAATSYSYDVKGLLIEIRQSEGIDERVTSFAYDALDHLQSTTDAAGRTTEYTTDAAGRVTAMTRPDGESVAFAYDAKGNLIGLTPPQRPEHQMDYSPVDLETGYAPPAISEQTGGIASAYNKDRDPTERSHALGPQIQFGYDDAGRLATRTTPEGESQYSYRPNTDQLTSITTASGERLDIQYDGPLTVSTQWTGTINGTLASEWNQDFRVAAHVLDGQYRIDYGYDRDGLLTQAGDLNLARDPDNGLLTGTALGDTNTTQTYTQFGEFQDVQASHNGTPLYAASYGYDKTGSIVEKIETVAGETRVYEYGYDLTDRLIQVRENGTLTGSWGYDANGNRIQDNQSTAGSYDDQDRLASYDLQGYNRPIPRGEIEYLIDGQDRRIGKKLDGTLVQGFLYKDQLNPIAELDGQGRIVSLFVYGSKEHSPDSLIKIDPDTQEETTYRILSDHLGSPRLIVDVQTGAIAQRMDYDVWGVVTQDTNPGFQPFGFAGGVYDRDTGLVRFGARDYDPYTGRWTAKDPIGFDGGLNTYGYVEGNPLIGIDPAGEAVAIAFAGPAIGQLLVDGIAVGIGIYGLLTDDWEWDDGLTDDEKEYCRRERRACAKLCEEAMDDPDECNVYGGSISKCIRGCLPQLCGGNKIE